MTFKKKYRHMNTSIKKISLLFILAFSANGIFAQTLNDAIKLTQGEKYSKASAAFHQLIKNDPTNAENYFYCGENYLKWNKADSAKIIFQQGIAANPKSGLNFAGLAQVQWSQKDTIVANINIASALKLGKKNIAVILAIADAYINYDYKKLNEAQLLLSNAEKKHFKNVQLHLLKGDLFDLKKDNNNAYDSYLTAYEIDSTSFEALIKLGNFNAAIKNYEKAREYFITVNILDTAFAPAYKYKAQMGENTEDYEFAVIQYRKYLEFNENPQTRIDLTRNLLLNQNYREVISEVQRFQAYDTTNLYMYRLGGYSFFELGKYDSCAMYIQSFVNKSFLDTNYKVIPTDYLYLGKSYFRIANDSLAVIYLQKAIANDPNNLELYSDMGNAHYRLKQFPEAIKYHQIKIQKKGDKSDTRDYDFLAKAYYYNQEYKIADSLFAKVIELKPEVFPGAYYWRAKSNAKLDPQCTQGTAIATYETVLTMANPEKNKKEIIDGCLYLGFYYIQKKDYKKAKGYYTKILELDPNNPQANNFMKTPTAKAIK